MQTIDTASIIRKQISQGVLMSLGARNVRHYTDGLGFTATILPFRKNGKRGTGPRAMDVSVALTFDDTYDVTVAYWNRGEHTVHYEAHGIYGDQLARTMLALDWDGPETLNPRIV